MHGATGDGKPFGLFVDDTQCRLVDTEGECVAETLFKRVGTTGGDHGRHRPTLSPTTFMHRLGDNFARSVQKRQSWRRKSR